LQELFFDNNLNHVREFQLKHGLPQIENEDYPDIFNETCLFHSPVQLRTQA